MDRKAFTLIELLVCIGIAAIIFGVASAAYFSQQKQTRAENAVVRASALDLAKMNFRQKKGALAESTWNEAVDDEARYQLLTNYLFNPRKRLGNGTSEYDYTMMGYSYILNDLTNSTTIIRNSDGSVIPSK